MDSISRAKSKLAKDPELRKEAEDHVLGLIGGAQLTNTLHLKWKLGELEKHLRGNARLRNSEIFEHLEKVVRDLRTTEQNMQVYHAELTGNGLAKTQHELGELSELIAHLQQMSSDGKADFGDLLGVFNVSLAKLHTAHQNTMLKVEDNLDDLLRQQQLDDAAALQNFNRRLDGRLGGAVHNVGAILNKASRKVTDVY